MRVTEEDVIKCRALFWKKLNGEITQEQLEKLTAEINGRQIKLYAEAV